MSNEKIADSIIIRVGGGIREVPREADEKAEGMESAYRETGFEQTENVLPMAADSENIRFK